MENMFFYTICCYLFLFQSSLIHLVASSLASSSHFYLFSTLLSLLSTHFSSPPILSSDLRFSTLHYSTCLPTLSTSPRISPTFSLPLHTPFLPLLILV